MFCCPEVSSRERGPAEHTISAGVARVNITPEVPVVMAGYGSRTQPFEGINDSLYAVATVFDDGLTRAAIIMVEVLAFPHTVWEEITTRIENETAIPRDHILLVPTHTHGAPSTRITDDSDRHLIDYNRMLADKIVAVTAEAAGSIRPALIGSGRGVCKMSMNRRALNAAGGIRIGRNPYGPCDHEVGVVRIDNANGEPFSLIVNWPTHATVMGPGNLMVTGDWPGAARRYIEREAPLPVSAIITAGASGDIDPIYRVRPDFRESEMEEIGIILGREVLRVAEGIETYPAGSVSAMQRVITLSGKKPAQSWKPEEVYEPGPDLDVRLSMLRVGNILFAGISGEVFTEIGMKVKELSPFRHTWVITHCNGASGYLVTDNAYKEGGYEPSVTRAMPGAEGAIIGNLVEMMYTIGVE